ncbi:hypothetical protein [Polyangium sp. 6x1]|uniref:hypothetical protein n=1 Tax=Polyangium sp. 6x1 TaxID=3042689 RepID=UPI0024830B33|nr:hypothetical protein [Polyangium sp. 6x1]MDI1451993.1 hypothetical protein [Polyangium sp. 6x1]
MKWMGWTGLTLITLLHLGCGNGNGNGSSESGAGGSGGSGSGTGAGSSSSGTAGSGGTGGMGSGGGNVADLCAGLVNDKEAHPMTALPKPALLQEVVDPEFGTKIRRITDVGSGIIKPLYSPTQAWNADETLLLLYKVGAGHKLYDGKTYAFLKDLDIHPPDLEQVYWSTTEPDVFFYIDGNKLIRYHVSTDEKEVLHTLDNCPGQVTADSHGWISWDANYLGLQCQGTGESFIYRLDTGTITGTTKETPDFGPPRIGATGKLALWDVNVVDQEMKVVRKLDLSVVEHSCLGRTADGHDTFNSVVFDPGPQGSGVGTLVTHDMTDGTSRVIIGPDTGYPYPPTGTHLSAEIYKNPGWVFLSIVGDTSGKGLLDQELLLVDTNPGGKACRIAHHRSWGKEGPNDYWGEPHVTGSPSGTRAVFASDWGGGATVDTYVVELPAHSN